MDNMPEKSGLRKILVIEDEKHILRIIRDALEGGGFIVIAASDGKTGLELALKEDVDLVILDIMLPFMDGFDIARKLRKSKKHLPIIILTARDTDDDKVRGLGLGVDDYMTKPFSVKELIARIYNRLRNIETRSVPKTEPDAIRLGKTVIDFTRMEACRGTKRFPLTKKEIDIIKYLSARKGAVVTRHELLEHVWGFENAPLTRTVDVFIARIRKTIEDDPSSPKFLLSIRDAGYKLETQ